MNHANSLNIKSNYYPFGMLMPNRNASSPAYRYGFNGMEKDDEVKGSGNSYDFGARMYDSRLGRWLSRDPLEAKYPEMSPYNYAGNNSIMYIDPNGEDIVFFNNKAQEVGRIVTDKKFQSFVNVKSSESSMKAMGGYNIVPRLGWQEAKMPNQIKNVSSWEKAIGRDYNAMDYQIAASTHLFNKELKDGSLPEKTLGAGQPSNSVPQIDVNIVKADIIKETQYGTNERHAGTSDVMQSNVGSESKTFEGDWDKSKTRIGLEKDKIPTPSESINAGLKWLYWKGITVQSIEYKDGKIVGGEVKWTGGPNWDVALKRYNGGGDSNYLPDFQAIYKALQDNSTILYQEEQSKKSSHKNDQTK